MLLYKLLTHIWHESDNHFIVIGHSGSFNHFLTMYNILNHIGQHNCNNIHTKFQAVWRHRYQTRLPARISQSKAHIRSLCWLACEILKTNLVITDLQFLHSLLVSIVDLQLHSKGRKVNISKFKQNLVQNYKICFLNFSIWSRLETWNLSCLSMFENLGDSTWRLT